MVSINQTFGELIALLKGMGLQTVACAFEKRLLYSDHFATIFTKNNLLVRKQ